ncbi:MAG TPA: hypothetical protein VME66_06705 [Candidatus Acidoferrales bacterium]|nr:hypothetical protein [Candidatus Acidoferrales bacterium]
MGRYRWLFSLVAAALIPLGALTGCKTPPIGVQDYGTVIGTVYDARTHAALGNVLVNIGSLSTGYTDATGNFSIVRVPVGIQTVHVNAPPGFNGAPDQQVDVQKDTAVSVPAFGLTPST